MVKEPATLQSAIIYFADPKTAAERFSLAVQQIVGKRVTYAELTGKLDATPF